MLTQPQINEFWATGVLVVENAITAEQLAALRHDFGKWVDESRAHADNFGETIDGRARFDLEGGHTAEKPALRRINAPTDISEAYASVTRDSAMVDIIADLIGPNVRYHHSKINSKLPRAATQVKWHQDFPFTPHTNTDLVTAWNDGRFTGAISAQQAAEFQAQAIKCKGKAGSVCLMHTKVAHGSAANLSNHPRTLFITVYAAADAAPCAPNPVPSIMAGEIVRGIEPNRIRSIAYEVETPEFPKGASFFAQQKM